MSVRRREAAHLGRRLAAHQQREALTAVALLELERRPGHRLLDSGEVHGRTAGRLVAARATRERLWRDVARYTGVLDTAQRFRSRTADLRRRLAEADTLLARVQAALRELNELASTCETARASVLDALTPVVERLTGARRTVAELELEHDDPDAVAARDLAARASGLECAVTGDPLAFSGRTGPAAIGVVAGPVDALCARLDGLTRLRDEWGGFGTGLDRDVADVVARRARVVRARATALAELRDAVPAPPPDRAAELRQLRDAVTAASGWRARHDAVAALRERLAHTRRELDATAALVAGLLERRDDLRGRFGAYRARSSRLGCADDPELVELAGRIDTRLWAVPSELARATRDLAAYRRRLALVSAR